MRSYLINLDRSPERLDHMRGQFARIGCDFTRVAAVDGTKMAEEDMVAFRTGIPPSEHIWYPAQIGIFLSHMECWRQIAAGSDLFAAVFEDDAHFDDGMAGLLESDHWIPETADIVRLETTRQGMRLGGLMGKINGMKLYEARSGGWGAAGYIIRRDVAEWLINCPRKLYTPVDYMLFHKPSLIAACLKIAQFYPAPCVQDMYHPDPAIARNFARVTKTGAARSQAALAARRLLQPPARMVMGKRGVPFGSSSQSGKSRY